MNIISFVHYLTEQKLLTETQAMECLSLHLVKNAPLEQAVLQLKLLTSEQFIEQLKEFQNLNSAPPLDSQKDTHPLESPSITTGLLTDSLESPHSFSSSLIAIFLLGSIAIFVIGFFAGSLATTKNNDEIILRVEETLQQANQIKDLKSAKKFKHLFQAFNSLSLALLQEEGKQREELELKKLTVGKKLLTIACKTNHFSLARYLLEELQTLSSLSEEELFALENKLEKAMKKNRKRQTQQQTNQKKATTKTPYNTTIKKEPALTKTLTPNDKKVETKTIQTNNTTQKTPTTTQIKISPHQKGLTFSAQGKWKEALPFFSQAIQAKPEDFASWYQRALAKSALGDWESAVKDFSQVIQLNPKMVEAYKGRADGRHALGDLKGAIEDYTQALKLNPKNSFIQANLANVKKEYLIKNPPLPTNEEQAEAFLKQAMDSYQQEKFEAAIVYFDKTLQLKPKQFSAIYHRGLAKQEIQDFEGAIKDLNEALVLKPKEESIYLKRALIHSLNKKYKEAIKDFNKVLQLFPKSAEAYNGRGVAYYHQNKLRKAISDLDKAIKYDPKEVKYFSNRGAIRIEMRDWRGALKDFEAAIEIDPQFIPAYQNRGDMKKLLKDYEGAMHDHTAVFTIRGDIKKKDKVWEEAIKAYTQAIRKNAQYARANRNPYYIEALFSRGTVLLEQQKTEQAKEDFLKYLELTKRSRENHHRTQKKWILNKFPNIGKK